MRKTYLLGLLSLFLSNFVQATIFTNSGSITINDNAQASVYPSNIVVSGMSGVITGVSVTLNGMNHSYIHDVSILLQSPTGESLLLQSACAEGSDVSNYTYTISDAGATSFSNTTLWANNGTYKPTNYMQDQFWSPAPSPPPGIGTYNVPGPFTSTGTSTFGSTFNGLNPNGSWKLFIGDFGVGDAGTLSGGWSLNITTATVTSTQLKSFDVLAQNQSVSMFWSSSVENNLVYYAPEYSLDNEHYFTLSELAPNAAHNYRYTYTEKHQGQIYYRIRMQDIHGKNTYSTVRTLQLIDQHEMSINLFPNPVVEDLMIQCENSNTQMSIYDMLGQLVYQSSLNAGVTKIPASGFMKTGIYFVRIQDGDKQFVQTVQKK